MSTVSKIVISASRRTDIPAFYMEWFMYQINRGYFELTNPYNRKKSVLPATPDRIHTIVFWSKNFGPFIEKGYGDMLKALGFNMFFNFTINSESVVLEPNVPPLKVRLGQLAYLCDHYSPESIYWRFDPICFFKSLDSGDEIQDNLRDFQFIFRHASRLGIRKCITSFMDDYPKIRKRVSSLKNFSFIEPTYKKKKSVLLDMKHILESGKIELQTCCENEVLKQLPPGSGISNSACINHDLLISLFGGHLTLKRDTGQRIKLGCGCKVSVDIGSYKKHPCYHNCLFCYANPSAGNPERQQTWKDNENRIPSS